MDTDSTKWLKLRSGSEIRGPEQLLTDERVEKLGYAFACWLAERNGTTPDALKLAVGRDTRPSGARIKAALVRGITAADSDVLDCDVCAAPALFMNALPGEGDADGAAPAPASQVSLSESIDVDRKLEGVAVEFAGWTDTPRSRRRTVWDADAAPASSGEIVVRYRANGTVRPHRWVVFEKEDGDGAAPGTGARIEIAVNAVGRPSVRLEGDSRR